MYPLSLELQHFSTDAHPQEGRWAGWLIILGLGYQSEPTFHSYSTAEGCAEITASAGLRWHRLFIPSLGVSKALCTSFRLFVLSFFACILYNKSHSLSTTSPFPVHL